MAGGTLDADGVSTQPIAGHEYVNHFPFIEGKVGDRIPFKHQVTNYNPEGHGPPGVYSVPHFDFHFYMVGNDLRNSCV